MADDNYPQAPAGQTNTNNDNTPIVLKKGPSKKFPYSAADSTRLSDYEYFEKLFLGRHFEAFNLKVDDKQYNKEYAKLRYVMINFAGLVSKICADMLFSEPITIKMPDGDQEFMDALWQANFMDAQCYEAAVSNSYFGDATFKLRVGPRNPGDKESTVIIEQFTPKIYFPNLDQFNVRAVPDKQTLAWTFRDGEDVYLREEIHSRNLIENKVYKMKGNDIIEGIPISFLGIPTLKDKEPVKIDESLIVHFPNWRTGDRYFGISDYIDLQSIFYGINNRMTKVDNILDKHGDPILTVPPGVLDEKGQVKKKSLGVIEIGESDAGKPEYIVWDAKLESAFSEIEKLIDFMYLTAEISPDILGLGQGQTDSGRALKFKLMRTIAKVARKKLYFDYALKEVLYRAQLLARAYNLKVNDVALTKDPVRPEIDWQDGLPIDNSEQIDNESKAVDAGLTTKKAAIMRIYGVDEKAAEEMLKEIKSEADLALPTMGLNTNPFGVIPRVDPSKPVVVPGK